MEICCINSYHLKAEFPPRFAVCFTKKHFNDSVINSENEIIEAVNYWAILVYC